jgi:hypothetical protein
MLQGSFYEDRAKQITESMKQPEIPLVDIPDMTFGEDDRFIINRFKVGKKDAINFNTHHLANGSQTRFILPGKYTRLIEKDTSGDFSLDGEKYMIWMSDTPAERQDHMALYEMAKELGGTVLVHGLGLGVIVNALLELDNIEHVSVWDIEEDILEHVGGFYQKKFGSKRISFVHGDAFDHRPPKGKDWTLVWHDIWPSLSSDNLKPMQRMCARFRTRCVWQECWGREVCRWMAKEERREARSAFQYW